VRSDKTSAPYTIMVCSHLSLHALHALPGEWVNEYASQTFIVFYRLSQFKNVKLAHTRLPSVGFRSWSRFLAVSLQVTWVINLTVGCHYFPPGLQLPPATLKETATNFAAWWTEEQWVWTVCLKLLPDSVATAIWTRALLRLSPAR